MQGVAAIEHARPGRCAPSPRKAVILCTGGGGRIFPFTTNAAIKTGDGMALAYRAGVPLKDMEFVQYHPTGLPGTGILITEASRGEGGILVNKDGYRYLQDYGLGTARRDSPAPAKRWSWGRATACRGVHQEPEGPHARGAATATTSTWTSATSARRRSTRRSRSCASWPRTTSASTRSTSRSRCGPVVHYMMGGVNTDIDGDHDPRRASTRPARCACVSLNGANRLGSNSLTECWSSARAPAAAPPRFAAEQPAPGDEPRSAAHGADERKRLARAFLGAATARRRIADIRDELQQTMEDGRRHLPQRRA